MLQLRSLPGVVLGFSLALGLPARANAEGQASVRLEYQVEVGLECPSEVEFRNDVVNRLGFDPFAETTQRTVRVLVTRSGAGLMGSVSWDRAREQLGGERRFQLPATDCRELAANMAFSLTVQIQLLEAEAEPQPNPSAPPSSPEPVSVGAPATGEAQRKDPVSEYVAGVGALAIAGWAPDLSAALRLFFTWQTAVVSTEAAFEASLPSRTDQGAGSGFESFVLAGSLAPCLRFERASGCGVLSFAQLRATGFGLDEPRSATGMFSQLGLRLGMIQPLGDRLHAALHVEAAKNLSYWRVELNGAQIWRQPDLSGLFGISVGAALW